MKSLWIDENVFYDGSQLRTQYAYLRYGVLGNSCVSWVGGCNVTIENMADGEGLLAKQEIRGQKMLHFIVEVFHEGLLSGVALQRLFASIVRDEIESMRSPKSREKQGFLYRDGDDLYLGQNKLSISVAAKGVLSVSIHFAVNVVNEGTPVLTCSLQDFEIEAKELALNVQKKWTQEFESICQATVKVLPLK